LVERDGLKWHDDETVETVEEPLASMYTPLKQGVMRALYIRSHILFSRNASRKHGPRGFCHV